MSRSVLPRRRLGEDRLGQRYGLDGVGAVDGGCGIPESPPGQHGDVGMQGLELGKSCLSQHEGTRGGSTPGVAYRCAAMSSGRSRAGITARGTWLASGRRLLLGEKLTGLRMHDPRSVMTCAGEGW